MYVVTLYRISDGSVFESRIYAHREELDKFLETVVLENCVVTICPGKFCQHKLSEVV